MAQQDSNRIIEAQLAERMESIEKLMKADALTYVGPIVYGADEWIKQAVEDIEPRAGALVVVLETNGGYMEVTERIAHTFRHHYPRVDFVVPNYAVSAGTVLVMSGDAIHMDYASVLGPIDPQVQRPGSDAWVPALGYLEQYERLVKKSRGGDLTTAELIYMVQNFDAAELYRYEQERELSITLLKEWLVKYKFKNWTKTKDRGLTVTKQMRTRRAGQIARQLNRTDLWHTHSRGIPLETLRRELKLEVDDYDDTPELADAIRSYYRLLRDYQMVVRGHNHVLHVKGRYDGF